MDYSTITASGLLAILIQCIGLFWIKERLKQSIKYEYDKELETVKKDLELEIDKKKRLYEGKLTQYKEYFALIDSYSEDSRKDLFQQFNYGIIELIKNPSEENTLKYIQNIMPLQADLSDSFLKFKNEINGLRLEAGEKLLLLLDRYIEKLEIAQNKTVEFLKNANSVILKNIRNPDVIQNTIEQFMNQEFSGIGAELNELQKDIFKEMRTELGIV